MKVKINQRVWSVLLVLLVLVPVFVSCIRDETKPTETEQTGLPLTETQTDAQAQTHFFIFSS